MISLPADRRLKSFHPLTFRSPVPDWPKSTCQNPCERSLVAPPTKSARRAHQVYFLRPQKVYFGLKRQCRDTCSHLAEPIQERVTVPTRFSAHAGALWLPLLVPEPASTYEGIAVDKGSHCWAPHEIARGRESSASAIRGGKAPFWQGARFRQPAVRTLSLAFQTHGLAS